ncbi:MAG: hypothetical protein K2K92_00025 [Duncaniella sp.]|nr:hypothetical protein [Duncaniella sp.]
MKNRAVSRKMMRQQRAADKAVGLCPAKAFQAPTAIAESAAPPTQKAHSE